MSDETRLTLLAKLSDGIPCSIAHLSDGLEISRQAITKHLHVLESAKLVRGESAGRECLSSSSTPGHWKKRAIPRPGREPVGRGAGPAEEICRVRSGETRGRSAVTTAVALSIRRQVHNAHLGVVGGAN
ncbi:MAG: helix-turn-helix domain-containing protein [Verrucomicrobiota bacterium]|nr:helix-turn-helix domain-containing protein [Verrucomicrobiota bacterium]